MKVDFISDTQFILSNHHIRLIRDILISPNSIINLKLIWDLKRPYPVEKDIVSGNRIIPINNIKFKY